MILWIFTQYANLIEQKIENWLLKKNVHKYANMYFVSVIYLFLIDILLMFLFITCGLTEHSSLKCSHTLLIMWHPIVK